MLQRQWPDELKGSTCSAWRGMGTGCTSQKTYHAITTTGAICSEADGDGGRRWPTGSVMGTKVLDCVDSQSEPVSNGSLSSPMSL